MEPEIGKWIVEFLARQPIPDRILNNLLAKLPLPSEDYELKKTLLIRSIQSEYLNGVISEKLMYLMELMVELDFRQGNVALESLKEAYCAVAVDCTVRFLEEDLEDGGEYFKVLRKIWGVRVPAMAGSENRGLVSEGLMKWKDDLEGAVCNKEVRVKLLTRNMRNAALIAVERYVGNAWEEMGPCLLERCARDEIEMGSVPEGAEGGEVTEIVDDVSLQDDGMVCEQVEGAQLTECVANAMVASKISGVGGDRLILSDLHKESMHTSSQETENQVTEVVENGLGVNSGKICVGVSLVDGENRKGKDGIENESVAEMPLRDKHLSETREIAAMSISEINCVDNPVVNQDGNLDDEQSFLPDGTSATGVRSENGKRAQGRFKHSAFRSRVKVHRHGAVKLADVEEMDENTPEVSQEQEAFGSGSEQHLLNTTQCMVRAKSTGVEAQLQAAVESMARGKLKAQPVTTPTNSADDACKKTAVESRARRKRKAQPVTTPTNSADDTCKKDNMGQQAPGRDGANSSAKRSKGFGEASPGASVNKPRLQTPQMKKTKRRKWTNLEEDTLKTGVERFGKGCWKFILHAYSDVFQGRSEVDLKDKWRNMSK